MQTNMTCILFTQPAWALAGSTSFDFKVQFRL